MNAEDTDQAESGVDVVRSYHRGIADELRTVGDDVAGELAGGAGADVGASLERIVTQVVGILVAEEQYLLPLVRELLPDGDTSADAQFDRHRGIEHQLRRLEDVELSTDVVAPILADVADRWRQLTAYLDRKVLPAVEAALDAEALAGLGDDLLGAVQVAPTRPREVAPKSPTASKIVGLAEGFLDRARDAWSRRGQGADEVDV